MKEKGQYVLYFTEWETHTVWVKGAHPIFSTFFKLLEILVLQGSSYFFLTTRFNFYSRNVFRAEDINENLPGCGNHN